MSNKLTTNLRNIGAALWGIGFAFSAFDILSVWAFDWRIPISYLFFTVAAVCCFWAEKREFGARVTLYRIHDLALYSSWKYLLIYFLWISLFAGFTSTPAKSLIYATTGWFSLIAVGFSANLLFCDRTSEQIFLLPKRLAFAFWAFAISLIVLFANHVAHFLFPNLAVVLIHKDPVSFFLYFCIGLPFLIWDFWNPRRKILPRFISGLCLVLGSASLIFAERVFFLLSLGFCTAGVLLFFAYKRVRFFRFMLSVLIIAFCSVLLSYFLIQQSGAGADVIGLANYYEARLTTGLAGAWREMYQSNFLGAGTGVTELKGVWVRVAAESGVLGLILYGMFFLSLIGHLFFIRRSPRIVVSNIALLSVAYFLIFGALHVENPYGAYIWCWYALWSIFAATSRKREAS